jgi:hypothetical protein
LRLTRGQAALKNIPSKLYRGMGSGKNSFVRTKDLPNKRIPIMRKPGKRAGKQDHHKFAWYVTLYSPSLVVVVVAVVVVVVVVGVKRGEEEEGGWCSACNMTRSLFACRMTSTWPAFDKRTKIRHKISSTYPTEACWANPPRRITSIMMKVQFQKAWRTQVPSVLVLKSATHGDDGGGDGGGGCDGGGEETRGHDT